MGKQGLGSKKNISFDFENLGSEDIEIKIGDLTNADYLPKTQYRFVTPYVALYGALQYGFTLNGSNYQSLVGEGKTPQEVADLLSALGENDTWGVDSSESGGNIFYVSSNSNVYTRLLLTNL